MKEGTKPSYLPSNRNREAPLRMNDSSQGGGEMQPPIAREESFRKTTSRLCLAIWIALLLNALPSSAGTFKRAPSKGVPDVYTVVLAEGVASKSSEPRKALPTVAQMAQELGRAHGGRVEEVWEDALHGFVIRMPEARARRLAEDPRVLVVEQDFSFSAPVGGCYWGTPRSDTRPLPSSTASPQPLSCDEPDPLEDPSPTTGPPLCIDNWGIDRIDQLSGRNNSYHFTNNGRNASTTVHVYVMDTGIRASHREFLDANGISRVTGGVDARFNPPVAGTPTNTNDCYGHGTHVAGIIGGRTYGVAKDAILHPVRIIGCPSANESDPFATRVARGLNWISAHVQQQRSAGQRWPAIINWSGGNDVDLVANVTVRAAVQGVLGQGIVLVQAAGNQSPDYDPDRPQFLRDACDWSFGGIYPGVIVAGGMDEYDGRWTRRPSDTDDSPHCPDPYGAQILDCGSNAGSCVDVWAPAAHVISSNMSGDNLSCRLSGTSMAAPHVAGIVALYLEDHPNATIAEVERALRSRGTWNALKTGDDASSIGPASDNVLVFSDTLSLGPDLPPVATYTVTCTGRTCSFNAAGSTDDFGITSYDWSFGDGSIASGPAVQHTFPPSFSGRVTLKVTDGLNHTDHFSRVPPIKDAQCISQSVPSIMVAGQSYGVSTTLQNIGTLSWSPIGPQCGAYRLGTANSTTWGWAGRAELPAPVAPGAQTTINYTVTAPTTPGTYNFQWRMVHECVEWFGPLCPNVVVNVQPPPKAAQFISQSVPTTMAAGGTYPVSVTFKNVGTETWSPIGPKCGAYRLGTANSNTWGVPGGGRVELPAPVAPGAQATFNFTVTAPSTPGFYDFQWRMVQECVTWFGDFTPNVRVDVNRAIFTTQTPAEFIDTLGKSWSVGNDFSSSVPGSVTHLRYYRAAEETGVHTLKLWTLNGTLLGSVTVDFGSDLTAGWEEGQLPGNGIAIQAGASYTVTVTTTGPRQSKTACGFSTPISNGPITATGGRWVEGNGIFPTNSSCSNFWTDIYFDQ